MTNPLADFLGWLSRRRASRALREAERRRNALMRSIAYRRVHRREFRPMVGDLREATKASLRASLAGGMR